jgi:hypothetical protein
VRTKLLLVFAIVSLCGCRTVSGVSPTVVKDVDFQYETIWKAICAACELQKFELKECNKDERRITSYYMVLPETNITDPRMYSHKAVVTLVPKQAVTGVKYDINISAGLYWKRRTLLSAAQEGWNFIEWDRELEKKIAAEFHNQTAKEQRIRQGIEDSKKRPQ